MLFGHLVSRFSTSPENLATEALAFIAGEFFERRDLFLVSRESGISFP